MLGWMKKLFLTRARRKEIVGIKIDNSIIKHRKFLPSIILHQFLGNPLSPGLYISSNLGIFFEKLLGSEIEFFFNDFLERNSLLLPYMLLQSIKS